MRFEGRKIRSGFPSLFCFHFFGWLRRRKRAAKKIFLAAGLTGGTFQRQIEEPRNTGSDGKENTAAAGSGRAGWRNFSEKYREPPSTSATLGFSVWKNDGFFCSPPAQHSRVYFQTEEPAQGKRPQLRSRLEEGFRGRPRRLIVRTALPCRHSPDARQIVIASAKELFFDFYFPRCSEVPAME